MITFISLAHLLKPNKYLYKLEYKYVFIFLLILSTL